MKIMILVATMTKRMVSTGVMMTTTTTVRMITMIRDDDGADNAIIMLLMKMMMLKVVKLLFVEQQGVNHRCLLVSRSSLHCKVSTIAVLI